MLSIVTIYQVTNSYYHQSELTYVRLWIGHNHSQNCDESHEERVGEEIDQVDRLSKCLPLVVQETANQRMCEKTKPLVACLKYKYMPENQLATRCCMLKWGQG